MSNSNIISNGEDPLPTALSPIWEAIWNRRPILGEIVQKHATQNLFDYTKDFLDVNKSPLLDARKEELIGVVQELLEKSLGKEVAQGASDQLRKLPLVSTTDHHAPLQHPFFLNSNIVSGLPCKEADYVKYLVVFSFASTSLNNASAFARGILFHGDKQGSHNLIKLSIFPDKEKMAATYGMRPFNRDDLNKALDQLKNKERENNVTPERAQGIREIIENYFAADDVLAASDVCTQISKINYRLWPRFFHPKEDGVPDLIYLDIETLVTEVLLRHHLNDPESEIYQMLFNPDCFPLVLKHFEGIPGAFSEVKKWGTYMFWALDDKNHRVHMHLDPDGKKIASDYRTCEFETTPEAIAKALREKKIFPAMFLCYLVVALYYGFKCLGGFCQVSDLTRTKEAWINFLKDMGRDNEAEAAQPIQTKELGGDGMVLAYLKTVNGDLIPAMGMDLVLEENPTPFSRYIEMSKEIRFQEIMNPMVPEIYKVLFTAEERNPDFVKLTPEQIMDFTGLQAKMKKFY